MIRILAHRLPGTPAGVVARWIQALKACRIVGATPRSGRSGMRLLTVSLLGLAVWLPVADAAPGEIAGAAFRDFNVDGAQDGGEPAIAGVIATATDANGNTATTTTDAGGLYTLQAGTGAPAALSGAVRIEFTLPASLHFLQPGASGGTSVQFADISAGATGVDVGFANPAQFAPASAELVTTISYMGDSQASNYTAKTLDAVVGLDYDTTAGSGANIELADVDQVGATWGVAYQRSSKSIFVAATMKRHSAFGPLGTGGIYAIDRANPGTVINWLDLSGLGIDTGADTRDATTANSLSANAGDPSFDVKAFKTVAKIGIGDIDMDEDDTTLWLVNLYDQKLYGIQNVTIGASPVAGDVLGGYAIAAPGVSCNNGVLRPWGVTAHEGQVYVGAVCSGELTGATRADLSGHILRFDPGAPGLGFTEVLSIDFNDPDYDHVLSDETGNDGPSPSNGAGDGWQTWFEVEQFATIAAMANYGTSKARYSVPLISDIEFDSGGNMLVGVMSRWGLMQGQDNYAPDPSAANTTLLAEAVGAGDTLRACLSNGVFTLEDNASCGGVTTAGANNGAGPGGGEYYYQDNGPNNGTTFLEETMGAMAIRPGGGEVVVTTYDPQRFHSNGLEWWDDNTGASNRSYQIYRGSDAPLFGKGNGMGDIEVMADPAPIEIGNRVWSDANANGIQDGGEGPVAGVVIGLYDAAGSLIETVTTAADGTYIFSNDPNGTDTVGRNYNVAIDDFGSYTVAVLDDNFSNSNVLDGYEKAAADVEADTSNDALLDVRDSDGVVVSVGSGANASTWGVPVTLGSAGHNNHGLDFGVNEILADLVVVKTATPDPVVAGNQLTYTLTVTNNGPSTAVAVVVSDTLPPGVSWISTTPSQGGCSAPGGVTCELGDINNGASATVTIVVTVN